MNKVLITYGTRALSQRIGKYFSKSFEFLYATCEPFPDVLIDKGYIPIANYDSSSYAHQILDACLSHNIEYVLPMTDGEIKALIGVKQLFLEYDINILNLESISDDPKLDICYDPPVGGQMVLLVPSPEDVESPKLELRTGLFLKEENHFKRILIRP